MQGTTKVNDSYFNTAAYNKPAWRYLVMCQEVGHTFGLDHQDETKTNANLGTCMDYTNDPDGGAGGASATDPSNEQPNQHDYDQLVSIYTHTDLRTTIASTSAASTLPLRRTEVVSTAAPSGAGSIGSPAMGNSSFLCATLAAGPSYLRG